MNEKRLILRDLFTDTCSVEPVDIIRLKTFKKRLFDCILNDAESDQTGSIRDAAVRLGNKILEIEI